MAGIENKIKNKIENKNKHYLVQVGQSLLILFPIIYFLLSVPISYII